MKHLLLTLALLTGLQAQAQFSEQEVDSSTRMENDDTKEVPGRYSVMGRTFDLTLFSLASMETDKANDAGGRLKTFNYMTFSSFVGLDYKFLIRIPFTYATAGTDRFNGSKANKDEWALQDIALGLRNPEMFYMPWDMGAYWEGRLYLPISQNSKDSGLITRVQNKLIFSKVFNKYFEIDLTETQDYYHQSKTRYANNFTDEYGFEVNAASATKRWSFEHALSAWVKYDYKTGVGWRITLEDEFYNKSDLPSNTPESRYRAPNRKISMGPQVRFELNDYANFIFGYADKVDRLENSAEFGKFLAKNSEFTLLSFLRF